MRRVWLRRIIKGVVMVGVVATPAVLVWAVGGRHPGVAAAASSPLGTRTACQAYGGRPLGWLADPHAGMVWVGGGDIVPGSTKGYPEERPGGATRVAGFWIDRTEVTHAQFADFARATGYVTVAERAGVAAVFRSPSEAELGERSHGWWRLTHGSSWRHPDGPDSGAAAAEPAVEIAFDDAVAYARWLGRTLPTEAEWELAARAGRDDESLHRAPRDAAGLPTANFWQGEFPTVNTAEDGFAARAPVGCYPANAFGLHDMVGNVWEWTTDRYRSPHPLHVPGPPAPSAADEPRVIKGGSFLCAPNFCARYRVSARHAQEPGTAASHIGFRTVARPAS
jgi:formylglycine-generating enzyme